MAHKWLIWLIGPRHKPERAKPEIKGAMKGPKGPYTGYAGEQI